jgi:hypothetical protein
MAKFHAFPSQKASDECPAVPRAVRVYGESLADATKKLAAALRSDPKLEAEHPEFEKTQEEKPKKVKSSTPSK